MALDKRILIASVLIVAGLMAGAVLVQPMFSHISNQVTVSGRLEPGVEAGCVILRSNDGTQYLLTGSGSNPPFGSSVTVTGYVESNSASYCMQGNATIRVLSINVTQITMSATFSYGTATASSATVITGYTQRSTTINGVPITASGYIYTVVETPQCYPQCLAASFFLTYLYIPAGTECTGTMQCYPPPQYYRLLSSDGSPFIPTARNGTHVAQLSGLLVAPSSWNCQSIYLPKICMLGDIYVQTIQY